MIREMERACETDGERWINDERGEVKRENKRPKNINYHKFCPRKQDRSGELSFKVVVEVEHAPVVAIPEARKHVKFCSP